MRYGIVYIIIVWLIGAGAQGVSAQSLAVEHAVKRHEVDAKRDGVDMSREEAVPAARLFLRIDSTYYVGWMVQGVYAAERAADYKGYLAAEAPLVKALDLLERDYAPILRSRTADPLAYLKLYRRHADYSTIANYLFQVYQNTEQNERSYLLLRRVQQWNMQKEIALSTYNMLSWITHRNRFYTHQTYSFLQGSLPENELLANRYLDSAVSRIHANEAINKQVFPESSLMYELQSVYHYKAILHAYNLQIDSARHYFNLMEHGGMFPFNNYGTFCAIQARFGEAEEAYVVASMQDAGDKRLQEWAYYSSMLDVYKGAPLQAAVRMRSMIHTAGSTPGFGWYNIALARACSYEGNLDESQRYLDKAAGFKELHIGTTLGKPHYEFSINLLRLVNKQKAIRLARFEDKNWWWHPGALYRIGLLHTEAYLQQYLVANQLAANPEREQVVYRLFSTESTVSWDEIWYLIKGYSTRYFYQKFQAQLQSDPRARVYKYFNLYLARLEMQQGDYTKAAQRLVQLLSFSDDIDVAYEQLFLARVYESLAICARENGKEDLQRKCQAQVYHFYPQLLPFSVLKPAFRLELTGDNPGLMSRIRRYNIQWTDQDTYAPVVQLSFAEADHKKSVTYSVTDFEGKLVVRPQTLIIRDEQEAARSIVYGLFKILPLDAQPDINSGG